MQITNTDRRIVGEFDRRCSQQSWNAEAGSPLSGFDVKSKVFDVKSKSREVIVESPEGYLMSLGHGSMKSKRDM